MTLSIYFDNKTQTLLDRLVGFLADRDNGAADDPFARDVVITSNLGLANWLQQGIAERTGIAAGIEFQFPGRFLWQMMSRLLDDVAPQSPFEPQVVRWVLFTLLAQIAEEPSLEPDRLAVLHARFARANDSRAYNTLDSRELLILSTQIAQQFAQLLNFRRDWLDCWAGGQTVAGIRDASFARHETWMSWLWQQTLQRLPTVSQRHPFDRFKDDLRAEQIAPSLQSRIDVSGVRRIAVFGAVQLSPEQLLLYGQLSRGFEVAFFVPDPSREFWQDLVSPRYLADIRNSRPDIAWLYQHEPSILGSWGRQQRDFLAQLRNLEETLLQRTRVVIDEQFRERPQLGPVNNLQALQQALLELSDAPWDQLRSPEQDESGDHLEPTTRSAQSADRSLQIHACHGKTRQVQVLHDLLLQAFDEMPDLNPDQVLVLAPAIDDFADAIDGVFGSGTIPYSIEGRSAILDPLAQGFLALLTAASAPVTATTIRDLLEMPVIAAALTIDQSQTALLVDWLARSGFRQAQGADRASQESGDDSAARFSDKVGEKHDWLAATDRLWLGLCIAVEHEALPLAQADRIAVAAMTPTTVELLGKLERLFAGLARLAACDRRRPDVREWCQLAALEIERWFGARSGFTGLAVSDDGRAFEVSSSRLNLLDRLQNLSDELRQAGGHDIHCPLGLGAFVRLLEQTDAAARLPVRLGSGVTFASIDAMRSVPARVTVWLGLSDQAFPRQSTPLEFDLLQNQPKFGDLAPGIIDRGAFLDAVCQTSDRLILLYDGRDVRSNEPLNPSMLIEELLGYLQRHQPQFKVVEHSLTRFSPKAFSSSDWPSYDEAAFKAARRLSQSFAQRLLQQQSKPRSQPDVHEVLERPPSAAQSPAVAESVHEMPGERNLILLGNQRQWVASLANPAKAYLTRGLLVELPREHAEPASQTPLDPVDDLADEFKQMTQTVLELSLAGVSDEAVSKVWPLQPGLPDSAFGQLAVQRVDAIRELRRLQTAQYLQLPQLPIDLYQVLTKQRVRWREFLLESAPLDSRQILNREQCVQLIWSAYAEGPFAALDTWLRHQIACLCYPAKTVVTCWFGEDSQWRIEGAAADALAEAGADAAIAGLIDAVRQVQTQAMTLFPRTLLAWVRAMRKEGLELDAENWQANGKVQRAAQAAFERELLGRSQQILYRDTAPTLEIALAATAPIYRRFFEPLQ